MKNSVKFGSMAATAMLLASTSTNAAAQQTFAQGELKILCQQGQASGADQRCYKEVKIHEMAVGSTAEIDRVLAANGWRLATPEEVLAAWEELGLNTSSLYKMSDGRFAVPSQADNGPALKRGVNYRSSGAALLAKGIFYVDASTPGAQPPAPDIVPPEQIVMGTATITPNPTPTPAPAPAPSNQLTLSGSAGQPVAISGSNTVPFDPALSSTRCAIDGPSNFMLQGWSGNEKAILETARAAFFQDSAWLSMRLAPSQFVSRLQSDAELRWKFAPFMVEAAWNAFLTEESRRSPAEASFIRRFDSWSGCDKNLNARRNLNRWLAFTGEDANAGNVGLYWVDPNPNYRPITFTNLSDTGPSVSDFDATNGGNPMYIGAKGHVAIAAFAKPALIKMTDFPDPEGLRFVDDDVRSLTARLGVGLRSPVSVWPQVGFDFVDKGVTVDDVYEEYEVWVSGTNTILSLLGIDLSLPTKDDGSARGVAESVLTPIVTQVISAVAPKIGDVIGSAGFSFAATILEAKLSDVIDTAKYEEALRRDSKNNDPVPIVPSRLSFDTDRHGWDGPVSAQDIERSAMFALLLKFMIAKPADDGALTLKVPTPDCPVGTKSRADNCVADIRFFRQKSVTLSQAQTIAQSNGWEIAPGQTLKEIDDISPVVLQIGLISSGDRISPRSSNATVDQACLSTPGCNQGFYYFPTVFEGLPHSRTNRIIQNAVGFERLGDDPWIISRAWPHNPDIYDFGDPNHPKFGAFLMENRNARGEYAYADNGVFKTGRIDPNDPRAQWRFVNASKGFTWIKPHASHETYLQMDGGALRIAPSDPANKGALWYTGGMGSVLATPRRVGGLAKPVTLPEGAFPAVPGFVRLQNQWYKNLYINNEGQQLSLGEIKGNWWSAMWRKVPTVAGWYLLQNRYRPNEYLHIQNGKLELGEIASRGWYSAQWREVPVKDGWVQIQNRWKPTIHLNNSSGPSGKLEAIPVQPNWASARWKVE